MKKCMIFTLKTVCTAASVKFVITPLNQGQVMTLYIEFHQNLSSVWKSDSVTSTTKNALEEKHRPSTGSCKSYCLTLKRSRAAKSSSQTQYSLRTATPSKSLRLTRTFV